MLILRLKFNKYLKWAIALMRVLCVCHDTGSGHMPFGCSLDEELQDANLWASCPAVLTKTPNQIKLVIPKASAMAHALQSTVCAGEVEPQRWRLAGIVDVEVIADRVPSSGQSFPTKEYSEGSHH